jgi:hypothetical protein
LSRVARGVAQPQNDRTGWVIETNQKIPDSDRFKTAIGLNP